MIENTVWMTGALIYTQLGEPVMTTFLNDYRLPLRRMESPFKGQYAVADFHLDYRNTQDPILNEGVMQAYFMGEVLYSTHKCKMEPNAFDFLDDMSVVSSVSQIVITESAATCAFNSIAASPIGTLDLNT
jgi:hypothetical protein